MSRCELPLSPRQRQLVDAIETFNRDRGFCPTLRELAEIIGVSISRAKCLADEAERRGAIEHPPRSQRAWRVIRPSLLPAPDVVDRLLVVLTNDDLCREAADEIRRLRARVAVLEAGQTAAG